MGSGAPVLPAAILGNTGGGGAISGLAPQQLDQEPQGQWALGDRLVADDVHWGLHAREPPAHWRYSKPPRYGVSST